MENPNLIVLSCKSFRTSLDMLKINKGCISSCKKSFKTSIDNLNENLRVVLASSLRLTPFLVLFNEDS